MDDSGGPREPISMAAIRASLAALADRLGPGTVSTAPDVLLGVSHDAGLDRATALAVVRPSTTADVATAVRWARGVGAHVVARGAGTGLSGGAVPVATSIVLALDGLDGIAVDPVDRVAVCGPGAVTADVDAAAAAHGLMYPPDPASWRQCTVGGNAATNAGGPRCLKYGVTAGYVQGLTAVLADGRTVRLGGLALDPPGPDLIGLLVGSEGTLAVVTELILRLIPRPPAVGTLLAAFPDAAAAGAAVAAIVARGLVPAALELMDRAMLAILAADRDGDGEADLDDPLNGGPPAWPPDAGAVLIAEVDGHPASIAPQLAAVGAAAEAHGGRCRIATDDGERAALWAGRRRAGLAVLRPTGAYHTADAAVPPSRLPAVIDAVATICAARGRTYGLVAHAGDGNLHPLVPFDPASPADAHAVEACVAEIAAAAVAAGGTVSGEHGVGLTKRRFLPWLFDSATLEAMRDVKRALDPLGTLNPGKVLPPAGDPGAAWPRDDVPPGRSPGPLRTSSITVAPADLVLTAPAAATLAEAAAAAHAAGCLLPLASPWPESTLGDVIGRRLEAPWRTRYGAIGDHVLRIAATLPDGRVIRAGCAVRKHVAGYALQRLFVGAGGRMGRIEAVSLRLVPAPPRRASLLVGADDVDAAVALALAARDVTIGASAVLVVEAPALASHPGLAAHVDGRPWAVVVTSEGVAADVDADVVLARRAIGAPRGRVRRIDHAADDLGGVDVWAAAVADAAPIVRLGVPTHCLTAAITATTASGFPCVVIDVLGGQIFVRGHIDGALDAAKPTLGRIAAAYGGHVLACGPATVPHCVAGPSVSAQ
ncbi:MAG: FAD-binding protein [Ardenticatenales bacterium]|nr:FAD-binding protein [Ardenticatenales bacterium]